MDKNITVLVTAIGSVAGEHVIESLKHAGYRIIGCDIYDKRWLAYADLPHVFYRVPLAVNEKEYLEETQRICISEKVNYIFPLTDVEVDLYDRNREWFDNNSIKICISPKEAIYVLRNKFRLAQEVSEKCKMVRTIPTMYMKDYLNDPQKWNGDIMIGKPVNGRSSQGLERFNSREEIVFFANNNNIDNYIVQPFIPGDRIVVDVVRQSDEKTIVSVSRREIIYTTNGCGISVYVFYDPDLESICNELAETLGIVGCVNFEFLKKEDGDYYLLECNPRFSAGVEFSALVGCNFVERHINCFMGLPISAFKLEHNTYIARKWTEVVTFVEK